MARPAPGPADIQPVQNEAPRPDHDRTITVVPFIALVVVGWQVWADLLGWSDVIVFAVMYAGTGLGVTVGFHRLLTHRAFATKRRRARDARGTRLGGDRGAGDLLGGGPPQAPRVLGPGGGPAQPARGSRQGLRRALRGLLHAHVGWLFIHTQRGRRDRYAPDLVADPVMRFVDRTFVIWALGGLAAAFVLG